MHLTYHQSKLWMTSCSDLILLMQHACETTVTSFLQMGVAMQAMHDLFQMAVEPIPCNLVPHPFF